MSGIGYNQILSLINANLTADVKQAYLKAVKKTVSIDLKENAKVKAAEGDKLPNLDPGSFWCIPTFTHGI